MTQYLVRRLITSAIVIFGVVTLVFLVVRSVPGDPVESILGKRAMEADKQALRECLELDESLGEQYLLYWRDVASGTFGELCDEPGATVSDKLSANIRPTIQLATASLAVAILIAIPLGVISALRPYSWVDNSAAVLALLGISVPNFWLGPMLLILFSLSLQWFPLPGRSISGISGLVLPAITLGTALAAKLTRMTRSSMLEVLGLDYIRTAKAKGLPSWSVIFKHGLRNGLLPTVTVLALNFGWMMGSVVIIEQIFAFPGIGELVVQAIDNRDLPVIQAGILVPTIAFIFANFAADVTYTMLDPRISLGDE
jgi:peptide/nickel transport system permease protein